MWMKIGTYDARCLFSVGQPTAWVISARSERAARGIEWMNQQIDTPWSIDLVPLTTKSLQRDGLEVTSPRRGKRIHLSGCSVVRAVSQIFEAITPCHRRQTYL